MLITGSKLNPRQRSQVLFAFVHRWTHENSRQSYGGRCPACVQSGLDHAYHAPIISDEQWLNEHAFHFVKDGSRLSARHSACEPAYFAESEVLS